MRNIWMALRTKKEKYSVMPLQLVNSLGNYPRLSREGEQCQHYVCQKCMNKCMTYSISPFFFQHTDLYIRNVHSLDIGETVVRVRVGVVVDTVKGYWTRRTFSPSFVRWGVCLIHGGGGEVRHVWANDFVRCIAKMPPYPPPHSLFFSFSTMPSDGWEVSA